MEQQKKEFTDIPFKNLDGTIVEFSSTPINNNESNEGINLSFGIVEYGLNCNKKINILKQLTGWPNEQDHFEYDQFDFSLFGFELMNELRSIVAKMTINSEFISFHENIICYILDELEENKLLISDSNYDEICSLFIRMFQKSFKIHFKSEISIVKNISPKVNFDKIDLNISNGDFSALITSIYHLSKIDKNLRQKFIRNICETYTLNSKEINFDNISSDIRKLESGDFNKKSLANLPSKIENLSSDFLNKKLKKNR